MFIFYDAVQPVILKLKKLQANISDFKIKKIIGRGHFGEVHLVEERQTGNEYAMKTIKKEMILAKQHVSTWLN